MFAESITINPSVNDLIAAGSALAAAVLAAALRWLYKKLKEADVTKEAFGWLCVLAACGGGASGTAFLIQSCPPIGLNHVKSDTPPPVVESLVRNADEAKRFPVPLAASFALLAASVPLLVLGVEKINRK